MQNSSTEFSAWNKGLTKDDGRVASYVRYGEEHSQWSGGLKLRGDGYTYIHKSLIEDNYLPMVGKYPYVLYHRYVMAKHLKRCLKPEELVHHIDGDITNNDVTNLAVTNRKEHVEKYHQDQIKKANTVKDEMKKQELKDLNSNNIFTREQAVNLLGLSYWVIVRRQKAGKLPSVKTKFNGKCVPIERV